MSLPRDASGRLSGIVLGERFAYRIASAQAAHECGLRQREWSRPHHALALLVALPLWLLALLAEKPR
jgi:hypothetical protein